jgi:hypothetical protein
MQVRYNGRILNIDPAISVSGQRVTYTYTPEMLANIPSIVQHYLVLDGRSLLGGELGVLVGYGQQEITETHVTITEGEVTVVTVQGITSSEVISLMSDPMPETFAEMKSMLQQGVVRNYTVQHDEFQGIDEVLYHFNGQRLFAFGVAIDESEQPIFN